MGRVLLAVAFAVQLGAQSLCDQRDRIDAGACFEASGEWVQAEAAYRAGMQSSPGSIEAITGHARTLVHLRQPFDALIELEDLLKKTPGAIAAAKLYAALCDTVLGDPARAQETLRHLVELAPHDAEAWQALGVHQLDRADPEAAVRSLRRARELKPEDPLIVATLAHSLLEESETESTALFTQALELSREHPDPSVYLLYGDYLLKHRRLKESALMLDRAIALAPHSGEAYYHRALAEEKASAFDRARADAETTLRESGDRMDAHILLQRIYRKLGDEEKVRLEADKIEAFQARTEREQALGRTLRENLNRAEPLLAEAKFAEAIPYYETITKVLPGFYEAWFALGVSYSQTGKPSLAENAFQRYLEYQPLSADGHASYGLLLLALKRNDEARKELEQALTLDPGMDEVRTALSRLSQTSAR